MMEIDVVLFAGGGGSELGRRRARPGVTSIAINHSHDAMAMHRANFPEATHYIEDVYQVDPRVAAAGRRVRLLWLSPDCTHHSRAKGGKPREQKIRGLAWAAIPWAKHCRPDIICLENVREWLEWGPIDRATGQPIRARRGQTYRAWKRKLERLGYVVESRMLRACDYGTPTTRERAFVVARRDGKPIRFPTPTHYPPGALLGERHRTAAECIDWSIPCPSIFGRRRRLADKTEARIARGIRKFVLEAARPFVIPVNHGGAGRRDHRVHDIDEPMPTVTGGQRGGHAIVAPSIVKAKTHGGGGNDPMPADEPLRTVTASKRGEFAVIAPTLVRTSMHQSNAGCAYPPDEPLRTITTDGGLGVAVPYLVHRSNGERPGQAPRIYDLDRPLGTVVAQGEKHGLCAAFLAKHFGDRPTGGWNGGSPADRPIDTVTARDHHALVAANLVRYNGDRAGAERVSDVEEPLGTQDTSNRYGVVAAHLVKLRGTSEAHIESCSSSAEAPVPTISGGGTHIAQVASFLARYNRTGEIRSVADPLGTQDTTDRYALVSAELGDLHASIGARAHQVYDLMVRHGYDGPGLDHESRLVIVRIDGVQYVVCDVGMRMLVPRELFRAMGFPDSYVIDPIGPKGKPLSKTAQIRACGNSVPPQPVEELIRVNGFARTA